MESKRDERKGDSKESIDASKQKIPDYLLACKAKWDRPLIDLIGDFLNGNGSILELIIDRATYNKDDRRIYEEKIKEIKEKEDFSAQELVLLGNEFLHQNNFPKAKIAFQYALELDKKNACALTRLGFTYYLDNPPNLALAEEYLKKARDLNDPSAFFFSSRLIGDSKEKAEEKKKVLIEGAKLNSFDCEGVLFLLSGNKEIERAHKAISLGSIRACIYMLAVLYEQKKREEIINPLANFIEDKMAGDPYPYPFELMRIHKEGFGVPVDLTRTAYLCRQSLKYYLAQKPDDESLKKLTETLNDLRWFLVSLMSVPTRKLGRVLRPEHVLEAKHPSFPGAIYHATLAFSELKLLDRYPNLREEFNKLAVENPIVFDRCSADDSLELIKPLLDPKTFATVEKRRSQYQQKDLDVFRPTGLPPPLVRIVKDYMGEDDPLAEFDESLLAVSNKLLTMKDEKPVQKVIQDLFSFVNTRDKTRIQDALDHMNNFQKGWIAIAGRTLRGADPTTTLQINALFDQVKPELQRLKEAMDKHEAKPSRGDSKRS